MDGFGEIDLVTRVVGAEPVPVGTVGDRPSEPVGVRDMGHRVEGAEAQRERQFGADRAHTGDHGAKEPRAILERATEIAGTLVGAQQLVVEVSVARLEIDELEPGEGGVHGGAHEVVGEGVELVVGEKRLVGRRTDGCIHVRVTSHGDRCGAPVGAGWLMRPECVS